MSIKNILIYNTNEPLPEQGGMERVTDLLARMLKEAGYSVYLLSKIPNRLGKQYSSPVPLYFLNKNENKDQFLKLIDELHIDCIIDQSEGEIVGKYGLFKYRPKELSYVALLAVQHSSTRAVLRNVALIYGKTGSGFARNLLAGMYNNTILNLRYLHFLWHAWRMHKNLDLNYDKTIMLSKSFINDFIHYYPSANREKLTAIPNPNTYDSCPTTKAEKRVLFVGRIVNKTKGVDKLLRIWSMIEEKHPEWILDIVGDGPDKGAMEEFTKKLGLNRVIFHGYNKPDMFYQRASIFCMTSIFEGFGMVLTEAMQHGVIPMAFDSYTAVRDIIDDGQSGFIVNPFDEKEYSEKLDWLMSDSKKMSEMSTEAIKKSHQFSKEAVLRQWRELLDSIPGYV